MALIKRRFPRYVCDGKPLGDNEKDYLCSFDNMDEFYKLDWVKQTEANNGFVGWMLSEEPDNHRLIAVYDSRGFFYWVGVLLDGKMDLPTFNYVRDGEQSVLKHFGVVGKTSNNYEN